MIIEESIRKYIANFNSINILIKAINDTSVKNADESFVIKGVKCEPILKKYVDNSSIRQYQCIFCSKNSYEADILRAIENSSFYEEFTNEILEKNKKGIFPEINENGLKVCSLEITSNPYRQEVTEKLSNYQIDLNFKYFKEG